MRKTNNVPRVWTGVWKLVVSGSLWGILCWKEIWIMGGGVTRNKTNNGWLLERAADRCSNIGKWYIHISYMYVCVYVCINQVWWPRNLPVSIPYKLDIQVSFFSAIPSLPQHFKRKMEKQMREREKQYEEESETLPIILLPLWISSHGERHTSKNWGQW